MNNAETQSITTISSRAIFGPISILFGLSLLYFKESSQFVTITASALLGLMVCWKWEKNGLYIALSALAGEVVYQWLWSSDSLTLWEFGLSASVAIAFITTALAKTEIQDIVEEQIHGKVEAVQSEYFEAKEMLARYEKIIREKNSKIDALEKNSLSDELLKEKDAQISDLQKKLNGDHLLETKEIVQRYESAIQEKNTIIDDLHERLDKIENLNGTVQTSSKEVFKKYEDALAEKDLALQSLTAKVDSLEQSLVDANALQFKIQEIEQIHNAELNAKSSILEQAELESNTLKFRILEVEKELQEKTASLIKLQEGSHQETGKLELALAEKDALLEEWKSKSHLLEVVQEECKLLHARLGDYEKALEKIHHLESENEILQSNLSHEREHNTLLEKKIELSQSNEAILEELKEKDRVLEALQSDATILHAKVADFEKTIADREGHFAERAKLHEQALAYIKKLEQDLANEREQKILQEAEINELYKQTLEKLEQEFENARLQKQALENLEHELQIAREHKVVQSENMKQLLDKVQKLENELEHEHENARLHKQALENFEQELQAARDQKVVQAEYMQQHLAKVQKLEEELELERENARLHKQALENLEQELQAACDHKVVQAEYLEKIQKLEEELHKEHENRLALEKKVEAALSDSEASILKDRKIQQLEESYKILRDQVKEHEGFNFSKLLEKDRINEKNLSRIKELEDNLVKAKEESLKKTELASYHESKIKDLTSQLEDLIEKIKRIESEKAELESATGLNGKNELGRDLARIEGMYKQLREQFEEKSKILNLTRKELFQVAEERNTLELKYLEEVKYDRNDVLEDLEKYIVQLNNLIESQEEEIDTLHQLISKSDR